MKKMVSQEENFDLDLVAISKLSQKYFKIIKASFKDEFGRKLPTDIIQKVAFDLAEKKLSKGQ